MPSTMKAPTATRLPEPNSGPNSSPNTAIAALTRIIAMRRPWRSASTADGGIVSAKNTTATSCMVRKAWREKPSLVVPQLSANTVIR